jgi:hypothetical protein
MKWCKLAKGVIEKTRQTRLGMLRVCVLQSNDVTLRLYNLP